MSETAKAEAEKVWSMFRPAIETLATTITAFYAALGSTRQCRHINQLWQQELPVIGLGFVPPEAKDKLEALIVQSGLHLHKGNGPLGKGVYFSFIYDSQLTVERLIRLIETVAKETPVAQATPVVPKQLRSEIIMEEQVARVEGLANLKGRANAITRPAEVGTLVDAFNSATTEMKTEKALALLHAAIPYLNLPEACRHELSHTVGMMLKAEKLD